MARSEFVGSIAFYGAARIMVSVTTPDEPFLKSVTRNFSFSAHVRAGVQFNGSGGGGNFNLNLDAGAYAR
jgi:hypothetical protein